jgi:predicted PurR-regulated permease PerM
VPLRIVAALLVLLAALAMVPLWAPIVLAAWTAEMLEPLTRRLSKRLTRRRAGLLLTILTVVVIIAPLTVVGVALAATTADFVTTLRNSKQASDVWRAVVPPNVGPSLGHLNLDGIAEFARRHGAQALRTLQVALGALTAFAVGAVVYVFAVYACIVDGSRLARWLAERSLVPHAAWKRLSAAFVETGRGLFVGIGCTALLQAAVATLGYVVVGVPQPLLLGFVTFIASLIPTFGTALVWVPVTLTLVVADRTVGAVVLAAIGCTTSLVDNFVRPWLSRYGKLTLPTIVTFVAMLGGVFVFGGFGLILGPLFVRLAVEALELWREQAATEAAGVR